MNPDDRRELDELLREQVRLRAAMTGLDARIEALRGRMEAASPDALPTSSPALEGRAAARPAVQGDTADAQQRVPPDPPPLPVMPPKPPPIAVPAGDSLELRVGTVWLARVGIVILLTGLVFLGNYTYQHFIVRLGAGGKLAMLYAAGAALIGLGAWLERRGEAIRNYARVLMAGGAATIYYTTYAAHFVERLRVIESPLVGGVLLLALAAGIVWLADRHRSQTIALLAVVLSYYTSAINAIGAFTLFSSLLLTGAAVFFLLRHRWAALSFASLVGSYGSYAFWKFFSAEAGAGSQSAALGVAFLAGYWLLFTAAVFLGEGSVLPPARRTPFLTLNNGAFFALAAHHFAVDRPGKFWLFALLFGSALLGLAALASRRRAEDRSMDGAYLAQGIALVTVGLAAKLTGYQLALTLAVESAVLVSCARWRHGRIYEIAALLAGLVACFMAIDEIAKSRPLALSLGVPVAALLLFDAWWLKRQRGELAAMRATIGGVIFSALGLLLLAVVIFKEASATWEPAAFAIAAVGCAASIYALRLIEVALLGQIHFAIAVATWFSRRFPSESAPWWSAAIVIASALALGQWWQRQRRVLLSTDAQAGLQILLAAGAIAVGYRWLGAFYFGDAWLVAAALAALGTLFYGLATRSPAVAVLGQIFAGASVIAFFDAVAKDRSSMLPSLAPVAMLAVTALIVGHFAARLAAPPQGISVAHVATAYRIAAFFLLAVWAFEHVAVPWRAAFFTGIAALLFIGGAWTRNRERTWIAAAFAAIGLGWFGSRFGARVGWLELLAIAVIPASTRFARKLSDGQLPREGLRTALAAVSVAAAWLWTSRWTSAQGAAGNLTVAWSVLALIVFAAGLVLRERVYRLGGFAILAVALVRVFALDVWRLETIYRILSFLVLGTVLLVLGFAYNRLAERIRRWL